MMYLKKFIPLLLQLAIFLPVCASDVAVLLGNFSNLDEIDSKALTIILARSYGNLTNKNIYDLPIAQKVYKEQNYDIIATSEKISVSEFIVVNAITLKEKILIDCQLYDGQGTTIFKTETTAHSTDNILDACKSLARSMAHLLVSQSDTILPVGTVPMRSSINNSENKKKEDDENKIRIDNKIIGLKMGGMKPFDRDTSFETHVTLGFNMKIESDKFFIDFGAGALIPNYYTTPQSHNKDLQYGGINVELGVAYYLTNNPMVSVYSGCGLNPRILFIPSQIVINPYALLGCMFYRSSSTRIFAHIKIAQNIIELLYYNSIWPLTSAVAQKYKTRPTEIGLEIGVGW